MSNKSYTPLLSFYIEDGQVEAGCDEAGRGPLVGDLFAAAVILGPEAIEIDGLNDSKKLTAKQRATLRVEIENKATAWAVARVTPKEIDEMNILNASILGMHRAISQLSIVPDRLLIDGNRFSLYKSIQHHCIIKGDGKYKSIAAASILAKTHRDEYMLSLHEMFPVYGWDTNMGYPTKAHFDAIEKYGITPYHRRSFAKNRITFPPLFEDI